MSTSGEICLALHERFNKVSQGREGEQWICIEEARSGAGFSGNSGQCDFLAINTWQSRGMELIGHEVKVSVTDWRRERDKPEKAEMFSRFCKTWWLVIPDDLYAKIDHEIPVAWGVLCLNDKGKLRERHKPMVNKDVVPVPAWWWVGWLAQIDRQHKRRLPDMVNAALKPERDRMRKFMDEEMNRRQAAQDENVLRLAERSREIQEITGINLAYADSYTLKRLGKVWAWAQRATDLAGIRNTLAASIKALDGFLEDEADVVPTDA